MARRQASTVRVLFSYAFDYVVLVTLIAIWGYISTLPPNFSRFSLTDITLQYPIATPETISYPLACILSIVLPAGIVALWSIFIDLFRYRSSFRTRLWELNCGILGLALSITLTLVITTSLKGIVGRPRPDVIDRCQPAVDSTDAKPYGLSTVDICTQPNRSVLEEGWRSWPSGHSSTAFAGLFYMSLYFAGKLSLYDNKGEVWKTVIVMFPTLGAAAIAASRVLDHRHHGTDVFSGSLIGAATAWLAYRLYFPSLHDTAREGRAWSIRSWGERNVSATETNGHDGVDAVSLSREDEVRVDVEIGEFRRRPTSSSPYEPPSYRGLPAAGGGGGYSSEDGTKVPPSSSTNGSSRMRLDDNSKGSGSENPFRSSIE
ncbi:phosphatidic acid phosphatase type 2/haloperoxidase [Lipomyces kononenkoae]|uniref:Phosphatidic acid phosphatase type 2/haloperoxidase n=1 Tax=Lipomyces kononenkoae TaxID=34357 RepID=A0ACC3SV92_LIPKO